MIVAPQHHQSWLEARTMRNGRIRFMHTLIAAGVGDRVRMLYPEVVAGDRVTDTMIHSKVMVVDDRLLRIGSANLNNRSMGTDTECDLVFAATGDEERSAIVRVRDRLLADHCGVPPEEVNAVVARTGSLIAAAETLSRNGHALRPVEDGEADPPEIATYIESVADPEQPIGAEYFYDAVFGNGHGRRGPLIKIAAAALLLLALTLAWHYTPLAELAEPDMVRRSLASFAQNPWAPLVVILTFVAGGFVAFPVTVLIVATAAAFGPWPGLAYAACGVLVSASLTYAIGARLGKETLAQRAGAATEPHPPPDRAPGHHRGRHGAAGAARALHGRQPGGGRERHSPDRLPCRDRARHAARPCRTVCSRASDHAHHHRSDAGRPGAAGGGGGRMDRAVHRPADPRHQAVGRTTLRDKSPSTVRVMTWNIHGTVGGNPRFDLAGVVELIGRWDADIVALQEVDSRRKSNADTNAFAYLQDALGEHGIPAKSITTDDGDYGQMLISRWPFVASEIHDISYPEREPRRAIKVEVETPFGAMRVVATHLGLSIRERRSQARTLLAIAGGRAMTTMIIGDFNDWFWPGSVRSALSRELSGYTRYRTFPSRFPVLRLDRVYCRPGAALIRSYIDAQARACSDHLPIVADVAPQG